MRSSLIVLNFNGWQLLEPCLESLLASAGQDDEVIVVDNASSDGSTDNVRERFPAVRLVCVEDNEYIFGLNRGLAVATGDYVAFLNNDMTVEEDFVDRCIGHFTEPDIFAVCPRILDGHGVDQGSLTASVWRRGLIFYQCLPHSDDTTDCFFAVGGQSFFRRDMLTEIGSIDPLLRPMYHEDIELSYRAWKRGWRVVYAPDAVCHHLGSRTSLKVFTSAQLRTFIRQNEHLIIWKNVTDSRMLLEHFLLLPFRLLVAVAGRDWPTVIGVARAGARWREVLASRREAKRHFRRSDHEVLRLTASTPIEV